MKTMLTSAMVFVVAGLPACDSRPDQNQNQSDPHRVETVAIKVQTIQCGSCSRAVQKALIEVDGVKFAEVNLKKKTANVTFLPAKATLRQLETAITAVGYDANDKKADPVAYEKLDDCCKVN